MATPAPINSNDTAFSSMDQFNGAGGGSIVTVAPGSTITSGVQNYRYNNDPTVYRNSQYFAGSDSSSPSPTVTTSDPYGNAVSNLGKNISTGASTPPVINTGIGTIGYDPNTDPSVQADLTAAQTQQKAQEQQLQLERDQAIKSLTDQEATDTTNLTNTQNNETGSTSRNLLAMQQGGQSASAQAYLNKLSDTHQTEMQALSAKYTTAIQQAQNAFTDKDFALAQTYANQAKQIKQDALSRNQSFIDNTIKIAQEQNSEAQTQLDAQKTQQAFLKDNSITGRFYQYPGSSVVYDSQTGQQVTSDQYAAAGGVGQAGGYKDIQTITPQAQSTEGKEFQDYQLNGGTLGYADFLKYNANLKAKASGAGALTYSETQAAALKTATNDMDSKLSGVVGKNDSYISPADWSYYRGLWKGQGFDVGDFDKQFSNYANPYDDYVGLAGRKQAGT